MLWGAPTPAVALSGAALTRGGCSLIFPSLGVEAFGCMPPEQRGIAVGVFAAFQDLAIGATGPVLGTIAAGWGSATVSLVGGLASVTGVVATVSLHRTAKEEATLQVMLHELLLINNDCR